MWPTINKSCFKIEVNAWKSYLLIGPCVKFHRIWGAPPDTFPNVKGDISLCRCVTSPSLNSGNYPTVFAGLTQHIWHTYQSLFYVLKCITLFFFRTILNVWGCCRLQLIYFISIFCFLRLVFTLIKKTQFVFSYYIWLTIIHEYVVLENKKVIVDQVLK